MSNKTPKETAAATASVPKKTRSKKTALFGGFMRGVLVLFCIVFSLYALTTIFSVRSARCDDEYRLDTVLGMPSKEDVSVEIADTPAAREQGLSGRKCIPSGVGMLFSFSKSDQYCFWMKDMNFSIDIVWLDSDHRVVKVEPNVSRTTYPNDFCSKVPSQYVLELKANTVQKRGLVPGELVLF